MRLNLELWLCEQLNSSDSTMMKVQPGSVAFLVLPFCLFSMKRKMNVTCFCGKLPHGQTTKSPFDKTPAEGNLLWSLGEGLFQGAGMTLSLAELLVLCLWEGIQLGDTCGLGAQEPDGSTAGSF